MIGDEHVGADLRGREADERRDVGPVVGVAGRAIDIEAQHGVGAARHQRKPAAREGFA